MYKCAYSRECFPFVSSLRHPLQRTSLQVLTLSTKTTFTEPGTPKPFTSDLARDQRQQDFPGASPASTKKLAALRKQLFHSSMVLTRVGSSTTLDSSSTDSSGRTAPPVHRTPTDQQIMEDLIVDEAHREPRERDPPDLHDVVTQ